MRQGVDDVVVGAGILGLAHAWQLAKRGRVVHVIERSTAARGASIRNFGMVWPIGQPRGPRRDLAMRSRALWLQLAEEAGLWVQRCGSLHVAETEREVALLHAFLAEGAEEGTTWVAPEELATLAPQLRHDRLVGGLWSPSEVCVDPRSASRDIARYLAERWGVGFRYQTSAVGVQSGRLETTDGVIEAERIWLCVGDDLSGPFAPLLKNSGLERCVLQMLRMGGWPVERSIGPMLAGGLTLAHYPSFRGCSGYGEAVSELKARFPEHFAHGVHVLVSQHGDGMLTVGDSHHYGEDVEPWESAEVEALILSYLDRFLATEGLHVKARWTGTYVRHPEAPWVIADPLPGVRWVTGVGGAGMTLSMGLGERSVSEALDGTPPVSNCA